MSPSSHRRRKIAALAATNLYSTRMHFCVYMFCDYTDMGMERFAAVYTILE